MPYIDLDEAIRIHARVSRTRYGRSAKKRALKVAEEHLWLDGRYIGTQYMAQPPHETWMGWLVDLLT